MNLIETAMAQAISKRVPFRKNNTSVVLEDSSASVLLHGNEIAKVHYYKTKKQPTVKSIEITDAGWSTVTTKRRLNALLRAFGWSVGQSSWIWYLTSSQGSQQWDGERITLKPVS